MSKQKPAASESPLKQNRIVPLDKLVEHPRNYRVHPKAQIDKLVLSLQRFGQGRSIVCQDGPDKLVIVAGHGVFEAAQALQWKELRADILPAEWSDAQIEGYLIADNQHSQDASENEELLAMLLQEQQNAGFDLASLGSDDETLRQMLASLGDSYLGDGTDGEAADDTSQQQEHKSLADRFIIPPFSVLDARQGYWQERKRAWIALGIQSELGRGEATTPGSTGDTRHGRDSGEYKGGHAWLNGSRKADNGLLGFSEQARSHYNGKGLARTNGQDLMRGEHVVGSRKEADKHSNLNGAPPKPSWASGTGTENMAAGTSIFDPVLCELAYRWFSPPAGTVLDPFAGGSVRGIVAAKTGRQYIGIDLRQEQVAANEQQARAILSDEPFPRWIVGDSRNIDTLCPDVQSDLIFTCPPYYDLEVYSDNPDDLSVLGTYDEFLQVYRAILKQAIAKLKDNRFVCVVVGDIRDKKGFYRNFVSDTIAACQDAGVKLYNEAILVTSVGSLPIRVGKQFSSGRKLGKTHQNVLVFCKGNPTQAVKDCGPVVVEVPEDEALTAEESEEIAVSSSI